MTSVTQKFVSFVNERIDKDGQPLKVDTAIRLREAMRQVESADICDYIVTKRTSKAFSADKSGWNYLKVGADANEFIADCVEFMLAVGLAYCVRTAEQRVRAIWKSLPLSWQTQPIYDVLYKFKERSDENLRSNLEIAIKKAVSNPPAFLEMCLKTDSGSIERKKAEVALRADAEQKLRQMETEQFQARVDGEFAELRLDPDYEHKFAECVAWYKGKYPKSADFIDGCPQAVNGYLINMRDRGGYENFKHDNNQDTAEAKEFDEALLDNE